MPPPISGISLALKIENLAGLCLNEESECHTLFPLSNITLWSSVCIDALEFNLRSIIIHPEGKRIYSDEINEGIFDYCDNEKDLIEKWCNKQIKLDHGEIIN